MSASVGEDKRIIIIGMGVSGSSLLKTLSAKAKGVELVAIYGHDFLEWNLAATYFLANPGSYSQFVSQDKSQFQQKNVDYVYDVCTGVRLEEKVVELKSGKEMSYDALILAPGYKLPLIQRQLGCSFEERKDEVESWGAAIAAAKTVVISGPGAVGMEYAGDIKRAYPSCRVVVLSRTGKVLNDAYPEELRTKFAGVLESQGVEIATGSGGVKPLKERGSLQLDNGSTLEYDVFLPAFVQGLATDFLPGEILNQKGAVATNDYLQSPKYPEIFAVGVNDQGEGFSALKLEKQATDAALNAVSYVTQKGTLAKHEAVCPELDWGSRPMTIKIGYGSYIFWDAEQFDPAIKNITCSGNCGFPCGPPICCWCCASCTAPFACGYCGGPCEGEGPAAFYDNCMGIGGVKAFPGKFGMKGFGKAPPAGGAPVANTMLR